MRKPYQGQIIVTMEQHQFPEEEVEATQWPKNPNYR